MHRHVVALCLPLALLWALWGAEPVGIFQGAGMFLVNGNPATGNATVLEGGTVASSDSGGELRLKSGARMYLYPNSAGRVYARRVVLERGAGEWEGSADTVLEAGSLRILSEGGRAAGRVLVLDNGKVEAVAGSGILRVTNPAGVTVARMRAGMALEFEVQPPVPGVEPPFEITGCVERRPGGYVLSDPVTGVVEELRGERLDQEVGNVVEITARLLRGVKPIEGASEVIQVIRLRRVSRGCPAPAAPAAAAPAKPAAPAPAPAPAPSPAPAGMSGAKKAVIAGVIVGGAGAGAAVFLLQKKEKQPGTISP